MNPAGEGYKLLSRRLQSCSPDPDEFGMSSLTANLISDLCVFQTLGYQKQMDKLRASCWPRLCAQGTHRNSPFLLYAGWSCMRDPPRLWAFNGVETLLWVGWLRDWEHLIEGFPKQEEGGLIVGEEKEGTVSSSCSWQWGHNYNHSEGKLTFRGGAWMKGHYVYDRGRLSLSDCVWVLSNVFEQICVRTSAMHSIPSSAEDLLY